MLLIEIGCATLFPDRFRRTAILVQPHRKAWLTCATLLSTAACVKEQQCAPGVAPLAPYAVTGGICPTVGRMGSAKLTIPSAYISGITAYKGVDVWNSDSFRNTPNHPTLDDEIDTFGITIRQANFKPVETLQDQRDHRQSEQSVRVLPPPDNRWIVVDIDGRQYPPPTPGEKAESWHKDDAHWGPFVKAADAWGLSHYISVRPPSTDALHGDQVEYFYDQTGDAAFMFCFNTLRKVPPYDPLSRCQIEFSVPKLSAYARIMNIRDKADLATWREMRDGVLRVLDSFIVP